MSGEVESKTDTVDFRVIDPPFVPSQPAWPNRPLMLSLVTLGGLVAGIAVAFLLSQLRRTVTDRRALRELTGDARDLAKAQITQWLEAHRDGDIVALGAAAWIVTARAS